LKAVREASPEIPVYDWSSFVLGCCTSDPAGEKGSS
jgi:hypothetical protein